MADMARRLRKVAAQHRRHPRWSTVAMPGRKIRTGPRWGSAGHMWVSRQRNYVYTPDRSERRNKALGRSTR